MTYYYYSHILQGSEATEDQAREVAQGFDFSECDLTEQNLPHTTYIDTVNGVIIVYDFAGDYYLFAPEFPIVHKGYEYK